MSGPAPGVEFAGVGSRLIACLVDGFVLVPILVGTTSSGGELSNAGAAALTEWVGMVVIKA